MKLKNTHTASHCKDQRVVRFSKLSAEAQKAIVEMVDYCIDHGCCMGQNEGMTDRLKPLSFRRQLEEFVKAESKST